MPRDTTRVFILPMSMLQNSLRTSRSSASVARSLRSSAGCSAATTERDVKSSGDPLTVNAA